jgi:surfeit locus 1 family protein
MSGSSRAFLLRPKWLAFHLLVFVGIAAMIWLAFWQLRRLDARREFNATVTQRVQEPAVPLDDLLPAVSNDPRSVEWRQVTVSGRYLTDQVIWFNRSQGGVLGDDLLTPLVSDDTTIVVNRGFVPLDQPQPAPPTGDVEILGRIRVPAARALGELTDAGTSGPVTEVRRVDLSLLDQQIPGDIAPVYLDLIASVPKLTAADPTPVTLPELDEGPHLSYAMQWFIFSAAVFAGWILAMRRSIAARRQAAEAATVTDAGDGPTSSDSPPSVDAASTTTTT